jgi:hypothetical protein
MTRAMANLGLGAAIVAALGGCGSSGRSSDGGGHGGVGGIAGKAGAGGTGGAGGTTDMDAGACGPAVGLGGVSTAGTVSWFDNGFPQCAALIETTRTTSTTSDFIGVIAVSVDSQYSIDVIVSTDGAPLGGSYSCNGSIAVPPYTMLGIIDPDENGTADTCTITITSAGSATTHAQGTFSGTISGDGATRTITNGVFDVVIPSS